MASVRVQHPEAHLHCVLVDRDPAVAQELASEFRLIEIGDLDIPDPEWFAFRYTILELNTAVKPWAFAHLLTLGYESVTYLDPDIRLYAPLAPVESALSDGAEIVLTPHLLSPVDDSLKPGEAEIRQVGSYNLGFCCLRSTCETQRLLDWWKSRLATQCVVDLARGIFVDQSWMDLVPGLFDGVRILRHTGCNVAYWNVAQRPLERVDDRWKVRPTGEPLVFFHFSGLDPHDPARFSKHQNRYTADDLGAAREIVFDYASELIANGARRYAGLDYQFGRFLDGTPIPDAVRKAARALPDLRHALGPHPFSSRDVLLRPASVDGALRAELTYAMLALHRERADLQRAFPLDSADSLRDYRRWFVRHGADVFGDDIAKAHEASVSPLPLLAGKQRSFRGLARRLVRPLIDRFSVPETLRHPAARHHKRSIGPVTLTGLFLDDATSEGIWAAASVTLPANCQPGATVRISGRFPKMWIDAMHGERHGRFEVFAGVSRIGEFRIDADGPFVETLEIPAQAEEVDRLEIRCDRHFIPRAIGLNSDERALSWLVLRVEIGRLVLVDATRSPACLPFESDMEPPGLHLIGYLSAESGVGEGARNFARAARAAGIPYSTLDAGYQIANRKADGSLPASTHEAPVDIDVYYVNADQMRATRAFRASQSRPAPLAIAVWHWEQPVLPSRFYDAFEEIDEIWAPSAFVQAAVSAIAPIPVFKVPHAIEFAPSPDASRGRFGLPESGFIVLVMYDFDSYQYRKNPQAAVAAFRVAAGNQSGAWLVIKTINAERHPVAYAALRADVADLDNVVFLDGYLTRTEVHDLESVCDCLLSLHRAEGFGLGLAEMMYLGKPVIATGWSANMEFMTPMNSMPVEYHLKPLHQDLGVYEAGQPWAEADVEHAADCLRRLMTEPELALEIGQRAASSIRAQLSPEIIGGLYRSRLALLMRRSRA